MTTIKLSDQYMFTESKKPRLATVPENKEVSKWGWRVKIPSNHKNDMRRIPSMRAIDVTQRISAADAIVSMKHSKE